MDEPFNEHDTAQKVMVDELFHSDICHGDVSLSRNVPDVINLDDKPIGLTLVPMQDTD